MNGSNDMTALQRPLVRTVALTLYVISLVLAGVSSLFLFFFVVGAACNPTQAELLSTFKVVNQTGQTVRITPIGTLASGENAVLPQFIQVAFFTLPALYEENLEVKMGESRDICYDWHATNFVAVLVGLSNGSYRELVVDAKPLTKGHSPNQREYYTLPPFNEMPLASNSMVQVLDQRRSFWWYVTLALVLLLLPWPMRRAYEKTRPKRSKKAKRR
jgi:hypothetical protein